MEITYASSSASAGMEITYASPSAGDLLRSSTAASGSTMPTPRTIKIIPLQHPDTSSHGTPGGFGNNYSSSSFWPNSWISRYRGKIKRMTFIDWIEMFLPCCRWIRTYRWR
ncbi:hypothetical protein Golob_004845, partial [Gossypium lobatum]|nr:hypothetical protein [Gossypium lobatum]